MLPIENRLCVAFEWIGQKDYLGEEVFRNGKRIREAKFYHRRRIGSVCSARITPQAVGNDQWAGSFPARRQAAKSSNKDIYKSGKLFAIESSFSDGRIGGMADRSSLPEYAIP